MDHFVKINTLFINSEDRTVSCLANKYEDLTILKKTIFGLINDELLKSNLITGKKVLLKPNWVLQNRKPEDEICMRTHYKFILIALEIILEAGPSSVIIADAPIQGCEWDKMLSEPFLKEINFLGLKFGIPILIKDLRRGTFNPNKNNTFRVINPISDYIIFDVGKDSYLDAISSNDKNLFRVTNYNPDRLAESHTKGVHKYCITKEVFNADIIISLPKIKTHQKTGITAALKNVVGLNGDKDFLPHHRIGGTGFGGDCYPGRNYLRYWAELAIDRANRKQGKMIYWFWTRLSAALWILSNPGPEHNISAAWYGNDTTWRMVLDLNKIVIFGKGDGTLSSEPQRKLFSLGDGIIGGQGDGPLRPIPLPLGVITFTDDSALHDLAVGLLLRFDINKIPLLKTANNAEIFEQANMIVNGDRVKLRVLDQLGIDTLPPLGWNKYFKSKR
jgi:uncharacterized protein (DUF362 family)